MAFIRKNKEKAGGEREILVTSAGTAGLPEASVKTGRKEKNYKDSSVIGILKSVSWPDFPKAVKYTLCSMGASAAIAILLYLYQYLIQSVIGLV